MTGTYRLIHDTVSRNVVDCTKTLYEGAQNGEIVGIAFSVMLRTRRYVVNVAGFCHKNPTFARGMVAALDDKLRLLVEDRDPEETR